MICGPMFSGKSEELMRRLRRAMIARKRVQVFKPIIDDRYSHNEIVSHGDIRMRSEVVSSAIEVVKMLDWRTQVVGIDEANFMGPDLIKVAEQLADSGKQVILAGLDTDFMGRPFSPIPGYWPTPNRSQRRLRSACAAEIRLSIHSGWSSPKTSS